MSTSEALIPGQEYFVLSIRPPWAWAVMFGGKDVENRIWTTPRRGRILIHASSHKDSVRDDEENRNYLCECTGLSKEALPTTFERSAILGSVELVDCVIGSRSVWAEEDVDHWILREPRPLAEPLRGVNGKLKLWRWTFDGPASPRSAGREEPRRESTRPKIMDAEDRGGAEADEKAGFNIADISTEQILSAFQSAAQVEALLELDLLRAASQELGCKRMGARVQRELKARLRTAIRRGILVREGKLLRRAEK